MVPGLGQRLLVLYSPMGYLSLSLDRGKHSSRRGSKRRSALGVRPGDCVFFSYFCVTYTVCVPCELEKKKELNYSKRWITRLVCR